MTVYCVTIAPCIKMSQALMLCFLYERQSSIQIPEARLLFRGHGLVRGPFLLLLWALYCKINGSTSVRASPTIHMQITCH